MFASRLDRVPLMASAAAAISGFGAPGRIAKRSLPAKPLEGCGGSCTCSVQGRGAASSAPAAAAAAEALRLISREASGCRGGPGAWPPQVPNGGGGGAELLAISGVVPRSVELLLKAGRRASSTAVLGVLRAATAAAVSGVGVGGAKISLSTASDTDWILRGAMEFRPEARRRGSEAVRSRAAAGASKAPTGGGVGTAVSRPRSGACALPGRGVGNRDSCPSCSPEQLPSLLAAGASSSADAGFGEGRRAVTSGVGRRAASSGSVPAEGLLWWPRAACRSISRAPTPGRCLASRKSLVIAAPSSVAGAAAAAPSAAGSSASATISAGCGRKAAAAAAAVTASGATSSMTGPRSAAGARSAMAVTGAAPEAGNGGAPGGTPASSTCCCCCC